MLVLKTLVIALKNNSIVSYRVFCYSTSYCSLLCIEKDKMCLGLRKQILSTQNTLVHIMIPISCSVRSAKSVIFIEFLMDFCIFDDIFDTIPITDRKLLQFKLSN